MKRVLEKPFGSVQPSVAAEEAVDAAVAVLKVEVLKVEVAVVKAAVAIVKAGAVVAFAASPG